MDMLFVYVKELIIKEIWNIGMSRKSHSVRVDTKKDTATPLVEIVSLVKELHVVCFRCIDFVFSLKSIIIVFMFNNWSSQLTEDVRKLHNVQVLEDMSTVLMNLWDQKYRHLEGSLIYEHSKKLRGFHTIMHEKLTEILKCMKSRMNPLLWQLRQMEETGRRVSSKHTNEMILHRLMNIWGDCKRYFIKTQNIYLMWNPPHTYRCMK